MEGLEGERAVLRSAAELEREVSVRVSPNGKGHAGQASQDLGTSVMQQLSAWCLLLGAIGAWCNRCMHQDKVVAGEVQEEETTPEHGRRPGT